MFASTLDFHPSNPTELRNAIATMVFYSYFLPDAFFNIKCGNNNFLFADAFSLRTPEYVSDTNYAVQIGGEFIWDSNQGELTRESYNTHISNFNGFNHQDIRYFFQGRDFENSFKELFRLFTELFRNKVDKNIDLKNFFKF